jgi:two-component system, OmpR family, heavy metal sensor histidine kinase CusS
VDSIQSVIRSLRARLFIGMVLTTTMCLAIGCIVLYALMQRYLLAEFDEALEAKAGALSLLAEQREEDALGWEYDPKKFPEFKTGPSADYYEAWYTDGRRFAKSNSMDAYSEGALGSRSIDGVRMVTLPDGRAGRVYASTYFVRRMNGITDPRTPQVELRFVVGHGTEDLMKQLATLRWWLIGVCVLSAAGVVGVSNLAASALMRPISHLANRISNLGADDLSARFAHRHIPSELRPIAERLDELLARLDAAFVREKSFTADVAHELRTPLAGLRSTMEVTLTKARTAGRYQEAFEECLAICTQMQDLVDNLLSLSQLESGRVPVSRRPFDLGELIEECWRPYEVRAQERRISVDRRLADDLCIVSDREKLRVVLRNLFDNAVSYVDEGGRIAVEATRSDGRIALVVSNTGCQLDGTQVERVFDRFWRAEIARSATGMHCGIGLSLCQKICQLLGGSIAAASEPGGFFRARISLPEAVGAPISRSTSSTADLVIRRTSADVHTDNFHRRS